MIKDTKNKEKITKERLKNGVKISSQEAKNLSNLTYNCDSCGRSLTKSKYFNNQGLCDVCIDQIQ